MDNEAKIRILLNQWFIDQNLPGMSPEDVAEVAKTCLLLDIVQVFLGYGDSEMTEADDKLRPLCEKFIKDIKKATC